jgi:hypothetical protein
MAEHRAKYKKLHPRRDPTNNDLVRAASKFMSLFAVPILAGDASLAIEFLLNLKARIGRKFASLADDCATMSIGQILFELVILRTYLSRPAENDHDIFELVHHNQVSRIWTDHEQALAACFDEDDTSRNVVFLTRPNPFLWGVNTLVDPDLELPPNYPLVTIQQSVVWTTRPGLIGGSRKPRHYRPPHLQVLSPGARPKPRPAYGKKSPDDADVSKRASGAMDNVEMPALKRGQTSRVMDPMKDALSPVKDVEHNGMPPGLRRGLRKRTAVKF